MCGITGILDYAGQPIDPAQLSLMTDLLQHRGPDDFGYALFSPTGPCLWQGKEIQAAKQHAALALGHRRLTIIDPTESSAQPLTSHEGRYWISFNGEIYNYIELRNQLQSLGQSFTTQGDTEVILKAYDQWGRDCVKHFNGMWAFAIWDTQTQTLFCSRDRLGIKPFYYAQENQRFAFASEIKSVLASLPKSERQWNEPYLARFILQGLLNDGQETLFKSIHQLLPAHCLEIKQGQMKKWRYWDIPQQAIHNADRGTIDPQDAIEQFRELLTDAIRLRFRADVPVGTNLSGGLDSSSIVALATQKLSSTFGTFTVEYEEPEFAEGHHARCVAQACQTDAHYVTPTHDDYIDFIEKFTWVHDEPSVGSGMFSQWHVMQLASQNVKVVLDGQGADELLGGYQHYFYPYLTTLLKNNPQQYLAAQRAIARHQQQSIPAFYTRWAKEALAPLLPENTLAGHRAIRSLVNTKIVDQALPFYKPREPYYRNDLNNALYYDLTRDNLPMLLQNGDRISMAFSIESRFPFLDVRLVEYVASLPYRLKIDHDQTKTLLRRAMQGHLPEQIINRSDKMGFPTPFAHWLKGPLKSFVQDTFASDAFQNRNLFDPQMVNNLLEQHCQNVFNHSWILWRILNLETWARLYLDDFDATCKRVIEMRASNQETAKPIV